MDTVDLAWNKKYWEKTYDWSKAAGDEWSSIWGSPYSHWNISLYPRIYSFLPANNVLEIGQGFGRWTKFLLPLTRDNYKGVELSPKCVQACNNRFVDYLNPKEKSSLKVEFLETDGLSLDMATLSKDDNNQQQKYNFIFSFDSLIHAGMDIFESYIPKIINDLLEKDGVAFIHHSNMHAALEDGIVTKKQADSYYLERTSSGLKIKNLIEKSGGKVLSQERLTTLGLSLSNCFTLFCRSDASYKNKTIIYDNINFDKEIAIAKKIDSMYRF